MSEAKTEVVIEPSRGALHYWADLWRYRELFLILAWRDIAVRYKQTVFGVLWAIIPPVLTMLIMTVVFGRVAGLPSQGDTPYALMVFAGLLPWQLFSSALGSSGNSLVGSAHLISKVYFPRLIIPGAALAVSLIDFCISLAVLAGLMIWFHFLPPLQILALPLLMLLATLAALGPGLLLTALNVTYRDFRFIIPFILQFGLYVSPVAFSNDVVRAKLGETLYLLYALNPMVGVIEGFRWAILGHAIFPIFEVILALVVSLLFVLLGLKVFRATERTFADVI
ncbi:MAG: ABC transporter permease [Candidatus Methylacidiphilales bacterium]|nr:ABC transporter permease [Candidatus Methylacidiphilales bacterium]